MNFNEYYEHWKYTDESISKHFYRWYCEFSNDIAYTDYSVNSRYAKFPQFIEMLFHNFLGMEELTELIFELPSYKFETSFPREFPKLLVNRKLWITQAVVKAWNSIIEFNTKVEIINQLLEGIFLEDNDTLQEELNQLYYDIEYNIDNIIRELFEQFKDFEEFKLLVAERDHSTIEIKELKRIGSNYLHYLHPDNKDIHIYYWVRLSHDQRVEILKEIISNLFEDDNEEE